jgi:hypothetical protein
MSSGSSGGFSKVLIKTLREESYFDHVPSPSCNIYMLRPFLPTGKVLKLGLWVRGMKRKYNRIK